MDTQERFAAAALYVRLTHPPLTLVQTRHTDVPYAKIVNGITGMDTGVRIPLKPNTRVGRQRRFTPLIHNRAWTFSQWHQTRGREEKPRVFPSMMEAAKWAIKEERLDTRQFPLPKPKKQIPDLRSYAQILAFMDGRPKRYRDRAKISTNVHIDRLEDGSFGVTLHWTEILRFHPDGSIRLNTGGWNTTLTGKWMNRFRPYHWGHIGSAGFKSDGPFAGCWGVSPRRDRKPWEEYHFHRWVLVGPNGEKLDSDLDA